MRGLETGDALYSSIIPVFQHPSIPHDTPSFITALWVPPWSTSALALSLLFLATLACPAARAQTVWTNTAGRPFTARLTALTDTHATFVMADGVTNVLALGALDAASQATARRVRQLPEIPGTLQATFALCSRDLRRVRYLHEEGRLDDAELADARRKLLAGFRAMFDKHGLPPESYPALERRLLNSAEAEAPQDAVRNR